MRDPRKSGTDFLTGFGAGCLTFAALLLDRIDPDDLIEISLAMGNHRLRHVGAVLLHGAG